MVNSLVGGGAERVMLELLHALRRPRFAPSLLLLKRRGRLLGDVPEDVPVFDLEDTSGRRNVLRRLFSLARLINRQQPDIVLSCLTKANCALMRSSPLVRSGTRLILMEQNNMTRNMRGKPLRVRASRTAHVRLLYRWADRVVTASEGVEQDLCANYGLPASSVTTIYNSVDVQRVQAQAQQTAALPWKNKGEKKLLVAAGRLVPQKGYPDLLRAFARIRAAQPSHLVILGEGRARPALEALARQLGVEDDVWMPGFVDNPWGYMRCADAYVSASHWEGFHLTIVEAMACRTPVVATDCDFGPGEIITHGTNGLLVPVGDPTALAEHVLALLSDASMQRRLVEEGARRVADFDRARMVRHYEQLMLEGISA